MRTHLNVAAKLELQTQEKMYESRLHHLENVLEGIEKFHYQTWKIDIMYYRK